MINNPLKTEYKEKKEEKGLVHLIGLSLVVYAHRLSELLNMKNPSESIEPNDTIESITNSIMDIIYKSHQINKNYAQVDDLVLTQTEIVKDSSGILTFQRWTNDPQSISSIKTIAKSNNVTFVDYSELPKLTSTSTEEFLYVTTDINKELVQLLEAYFLVRLKYSPRSF